MGQFGFQKDHPKGCIGGGWKLREEMERELRGCCSIQSELINRDANGGKRVDLNGLFVV